MTPRPAAILSLVLSSACTAAPAGTEPAAAAPRVAAPAASPPTAPPPVPVAAVKDVPPPAAGCRALVNLEAQGYRVVDLRLGAPHQATVGEGLVARLDDGRSFALDVVSDEKAGKNAHGTGKATWDVLMMAPIPGGKWEVLHGDTPELVLPDADTPGEFDDNRTISVVGIFGDYLSLSAGEEGYGGGAHGFDDSWYLTLHLPGRGAAGLEFLGPDALATAAASLTQVNRERLEQSLEEVPAPQDLARFGLALTRTGEAEPPVSPEAGLELRTVISCCSWAENHNKFFLEAPLERAPAALEGQFKLGATAQARFEAPDGCGAVGFADGKLWARLGREGEPQPVALPGVSARALLGVRWIPAADPLAITQLPPRPTAPREFVKLGPEDEARIVAAHLGAGDSLAHPMFRGNFGPSPDTILVFSHNSANGPIELKGFALVPDGEGHRKIALPNFADGQYNDSVRALLFDNLDADPEREILVMGVYIHGIGPDAGKPFTMNTALDWDGDAFVELKDVSRKIATLESAAKIREALRAK